jgi:hypothetical protein
MMTPIILEDLSDEILDTILSLHPKDRATYFEKMAKNYYPHTKPDSDDFHSLIEAYNSSFYVEKLYRTNRFFNEKFTIVYTETGLVRNAICDLFFADDDLITH